MNTKVITKLEFAMILTSLDEHGVDVITARYSGGGDSGEIEEVDLEYRRVLEKNERRSYPENWGQISEEIQEWLYQRLEGEADWCNNEGGEGDLRIDVPSGEYTINHGTRPEINWDELAGDLKEELKDH